MVVFVLFEDNVAPGLVEISACHGGAAESLEERNQLDIYISCPPFGSTQARPRRRLLKRHSFRCTLQTPGCFKEVIVLAVKRRSSRCILRSPD